MKTDGTGDASPPIQTLLDVIEKLRGKDGCPWDREQTLATLKQYLIEECYEVIDAIDANDVARHREELGDVLLHVVLQAQIRREHGLFCFDDVVETVRDKLIRRHPHVFGEVRVSDTTEVLKNWEAIKANEKKDGIRSALEGVPRHLPALQRAQRIQSRASRVGFDWENSSDVLAKIGEELDEVKQAAAESEKEHLEEELGDLLFAIVNFCRFLEINAEEALERTIVKFTRRFQEVERQMRNDGRNLEGSSLAEMDAYWEAAKKTETAALPKDAV